MSSIHHHHQWWLNWNYSEETEMGETAHTRIIYVLVDRDMCHRSIQPFLPICENKKKRRAGNYNHVFAAAAAAVMAAWIIFPSQKHFFWCLSHYISLFSLHLRRLNFPSFLGGLGDIYPEFRLSRRMYTILLARANGDGCTLHFVREHSARPPPSVLYNDMGLEVKKKKRLSWRHAAVIRNPPVIGRHFKERTCIGPNN